MVFDDEQVVVIAYYAHVPHHAQYANASRKELI